jgi:hypothetical protein
MPSPKNTCFVVRPMHNRAENVNEWYIEPALREDFTVCQPGKPSMSITTDIFDHLQDDALVVAFLSSPSRVPAEGNNWLWNPNVMLEAGFRLGVHQPIVFVREKRIQPDEPFLPFDLFDHTVIELPSAEDELKIEVRRRIVTEIQEAAKRFIIVDPPFSVHPTATMVFGSKGGTISAASNDAATFFRYAPGKRVVGLDVRDLVAQLASHMPPCQSDAFQAEQDQLIGALLMGRKPSATVCMVFGTDPIEPGVRPDNAYLPVVSDFRSARGLTELRVLYLSVKATAVAGKDRVVRCFLDNAGPE